MKVFKKNQIIIYVLALMLVAAGYLNYTTNSNSANSIIQTTSTEEELISSANIGDAQLVNGEVIENNVINNETTVTSTDTKKNDDYFTTSKLERDTMYSQTIETYEKILNSSNSLETQRQSATEQITKINNEKNSILICENLIKTKGFSDVVIFINGDSVSVIVEDEQLSPEEVAQIQNIISREMGTKAQNIHISNK